MNNESSLYQLHYLLIAVNRGFAVCSPLKYDYWWTRENIITSVTLVWVSASALECIKLVRWVMAQPPRFSIYQFLQRVVTLPSLGIYSAALGWVLVNRIYARYTFVFST